MNNTFTQPSSLIAFEEWAKKNGCFFPKLKIVHFENSIWGCGGWCEAEIKVDF